MGAHAAAEVMRAVALMVVGQHAIGKKKLALLCQKAENEFVGARCGIMDQFISCHGHEGSAVLLDCRCLDFRAVRLPSAVHLVICNTMVQHKHGSGEYNVRRGECESAASQFVGGLSEDRALIAVNLPAIDDHTRPFNRIKSKKSRRVS